MPSPRGRLAGVDGIRAAAATCILVWHTYIYASVEGPPDFGWASRYLAPQLQLGVWTFFCLSAFLLYRPFAAAVLEGRDFPSVRRYLRGRAMRIVPAYWVILTLATFVFGVATYRAAGGGIGIHIPSWLAQMLFVHSFHPSTVLTGIGPTWSLSVEVVFYLALPLLGGVAWLIGRRARTPAGKLAAVLAPALILLAVGVLCREIGDRFLSDASDPYGFRGTWFAVWERSFLSQCDLFAFGIVLAVAKVQLDRGRLRLPDSWRAGAFLAAVALGIPLVTMLTEGKMNANHYNTLMGLVNGLLVALVVLVPRDAAPRDRLVRLLELRPIRYSGEISYSVFLWHYPVVVFLRKHELGMSGQAGFAANLLIVIAITWVLASLTFRFVERPFMARKADPRVRGEAPAGTAAQAPAAP
jgi:peptidoglycan/LPS O-acetylase OafA/YrhL